MVLVPNILTSCLSMSNLFTPPSVQSLAANTPHTKKCILIFFTPVAPLYNGNTIMFFALHYFEGIKVSSTESWWWMLERNYVRGIGRTQTVIYSRRNSSVYLAKEQTAYARCHLVRLIASVYEANVSLPELHAKQPNRSWSQREQCIIQPGQKFVKRCSDAIHLINFCRM